MDAPSQADRRRAPRADLGLLVQFRSDDFDTFLREHAADLSVGGMFVRTEAPRELDEVLCLRFTCGEDETIIEALARVVRVNPPDHAYGGMGLEFLEMDDETRALIDRIVDRNLRGGR